MPALDGVRALAILLVVAFHAWELEPGVYASEYFHAGRYDPTRAADNAVYYGHTGVQLFFVLSGFLLFQPYARWLLGTGRQPSTRTFYVRRLRRVAPAYWLSLLVAAAVQTYVQRPLAPAIAADTALHLVWLHNITLTTAFSINSVYWTMAVEVQFYLLLPVLAALLAWLIRRMSIWRATLLVCGALLGLSALVAPAASAMAVAYNSPGFGGASIPFLGPLLFSSVSLPYSIGVFACGIVLAVLVERERANRRTAGWVMPAGAFAASSGLAAAIIAVPALHNLPQTDLAFGPLYAVLMYAVLRCSAIAWAFRLAPVRFIGLISYSLYIWHFPVVRFVEQVALRRVPMTPPARELWGVALDLALAVPLAYVWCQLIERPFLHRPHADGRAPGQ